MRENLQQSRVNFTLESCDYSRSCMCLLLSPKPKAYCCLFYKTDISVESHKHKNDISMLILVIFLINLTALVLNSRSLVMLNNHSFD